MNSFGSTLKQLRKSKGLTQKQLAEVLYITERNYQRYEQDVIDVQKSKLLFLADYFDVSLDYLVGRTDNPKSHKS